MSVLYYSDFKYFYNNKEVENDEENNLLTTKLNEDGEDVEIRDILIFQDFAFLLNDDDTLVKYKIKLEKELPKDTSLKDHENMLDVEPEFDFSDFDDERNHNKDVNNKNEKKRNERR